MLPLLASLVLLQAAPAPVLPPGVSAQFQRQVLEVERLLEAGDFDRATHRLAKMPTPNVSVVWDDSKAPAEIRPELARGRDLAFEAWKTAVPGLSFEVASSGSVRFAFAKDGPATLREWQDDKLNVVLPIAKGQPPKPLTANDVRSEVMQAVGLHLGLGTNPVASNAMSDPLPAGPIPVMLIRYDAMAALANLQALDALRKAATNRTRLAPASARLEVSEETIELGRMLQGDVARPNIVLHNRGNAPLKLWMRADCGCITASAELEVPAGASQKLDVQFDSREFMGEQDKRLWLVTNDPEKPVRVLRLHSKIEPMYRFLAPKGNVAVLGEGPTMAEVYLTFKEREPFRVRKIAVNGFQAEVEYEGWSGKMADPQMGEGEVERRGYKFLITIPDSLPPGRVPATLMVLTDSKEHPLIQFNLFAQKGIVAMPDQLFLGDLTGPKMAKFLLGRPGKPFKVLSVSSSSPVLKAEAVSGKTPDEYTIQVSYNGAAPKGDLHVELTIRTDDPSQPEIKVPVIGAIR